MSKPNICLVMIVKDEENVIERCLTALKPTIDCYAIMDTGSSDDTKKIIQKTMKGIRGKIYDMPFHSFAVNRSRVMSLARQDFPESDYQLMIDADDTWTIPEGFEWPELGLDAYHITHSMGGSTWKRPCLMRTMTPWIYHGAAHEHIECAMHHRLGIIDGPVINCGFDGSRRVKEGKNKYKRIAGVLEKEVEKDPRNARNVFYLAQSWRDAGDPVKAMKYYTQRAEMGGWQEEVWNARYEIARTIERLGRPLDEVTKAYLEAYRSRPQRAESLWALAYACRRNSDIAMAYVYASAAAKIPKPNDALFVNHSVYEWRALDELCVAASKLKMYDVAKDAALKILANPRVQGGHRIRNENNLTWACEPITPQPLEENPKVVVPLIAKSPSVKNLRRSIKSILKQTHENLELVIIDAKGDVPWEELSDIEDPRLRRMTSSEASAVPFRFFDAIARETDASVMAIQYAEDKSAPDRLEKLIAEMRRTTADLVLSHVAVDGEERQISVERLALEPDKLAPIGSHLGLWRVHSIRTMGGCIGPFDANTGKVMVGLIAQLGRPSFVRESLYEAAKERDYDNDAGEDQWQKARAHENPKGYIKTLMSMRAESSESLGLSDVTEMKVEK